MPQPNNIHLETIIVQSENMLSSKVDEEVIFMSLEKEKYYGLDSLSASIWNLLDKPISLNAVCKKLTLEYDVKLETCQEDVIEFIQKLVDAKLLIVKKNC